MTIKTMAPRSSFQVSPDERYLTYTLLDPARQERFRSGRPNSLRPSGAPWLVLGSEVWVLALPDGEAHRLSADEGTDWCPRWSPDSRYLAFYSDRSGLPQLWVWDRDTGRLDPIGESPIHSINGNEAPLWTPDSAALVVKLREDDPSVSPAPEAPPRASGVIVWEHDPASFRTSAAPPPGPAIPSVRPTRPAQVERFCGALAVVRRDTGAARRITSALTMTGWTLSPDGSSVALFDFVSTRSASNSMPTWNLLRVPLDGSEPECLVEHVPQSTGVCLSWSPLGDFLAYADSERCDLHVVPSGGGPPRNLTSDLVEKLIPRYTESRPVWDADGRSLIGLAGGRVLRVPVECGPPRTLSLEIDRELKGMVEEADVLTSPDGGESMYALAQDSETKRHGVYRVHLQENRADLLYEAPGQIGSLHVHASGRSSTPSVYYSFEDAATPPDLWKTDPAFQHRHRLTQFNPHLEGLRFGETRLMEWTSGDGRRQQGALLLPADGESRQRWPVIVLVYAGDALSGNLYRFGLGDAHRENYQILASRGYGVLAMDAPLQTHEPLKELPGLLLPALDRLDELGIADPERFGVMGGSYGGYSVQALITQTTRFRAAVSISGISDLVGYYLALNEDGTSTNVNWTEQGQGRMEGTLWDHRQRYVENSPIFHLDRVETPLLLLHGDRDAIPIAQPTEAFAGLRRLDKTVTLVRYAEEGHCIMDHLKSVKDRWRRVIDWFDRYLMDE